MAEIRPWEEASRVSPQTADKLGSEAGTTRMASRRSKTIAVLLPHLSGLDKAIPLGNGRLDRDPGDPHVVLGNDFLKQVQFLGHFDNFQLAIRTDRKRARKNEDETGRA